MTQLSRYRSEENPRSTTLYEAIEAYLRYLAKERELGRNSLLHYRHDLHLFSRFVERVEETEAPEFNVAHLSPRHVQAFLDDQTFRRGNSLSSNRRRLSCLRGFFRFLGMRGYIRNWEIRTLLPKPSLPHRTTLTRREIKAFINATKTAAPCPIRDEAIFRLFLTCAPRLSELLALRREDVDLVKGTIRLGRDPFTRREIPMPPETHEAIERYIKDRPKSKSDRLFLNRHDQPITKGAVYHSLRRCLIEAGLSHKNVNVNTLRNTCIHQKVEDGSLPLHLIPWMAGTRRLPPPWTKWKKQSGNDERGNS